MTYKSQKTYNGDNCKEYRQTSAKALSARIGHWHGTISSLSWTATKRGDGGSAVTGPSCAMRMLIAVSGVVMLLAMVVLVPDIPL
jgi:hypothetical protein